MNMGSLLAIVVWIIQDGLMWLVDIMRKKIVFLFSYLVLKIPSWWDDQPSSFYVLSLVIRLTQTKTYNDFYGK